MFPIKKTNQFWVKLLFALLLGLLSGVIGFGQDGRGVGVRPTQTAEKRLALVIGNGAYQNTSPLTNPPNDATDMAATLKTLGFEVLSGTNRSKREMENLIREFGEKLAKEGGVGLFFYAGHGIQYRGGNYLIPVEANIPAEDEIEYATINLNFLLNKMDAAKNNLNIVILDACRNNPFARSWRNFRDTGDSSGLAKVTPPTGTIMLYSTQPGNVASDGTGRNGLFTESLLKEIKKPNVELDAMVKALARDVSAKSDKKQLPWKEGIVLGDFYFAGINAAANNATNNTQNETKIVAKDRAAQEQEAWDLVKNSSYAQDLRDFLREFPSGANAGNAQIKLEQLMWESVRTSNDAKKVKGYLDEFPSGANASSGRILYGQLTRAKVEPTPTPNKRLTSQEKLVLNNLRTLSAAADQFYLENGVYKATFDDLVGPKLYIKWLKPVAGENYREIRFEQGQPLRVTLPSGKVIEYVP